MSGRIVVTSGEGRVSFPTETHKDVRDIRVEGKGVSLPHTVAKVEVGFADETDVEYSSLETISIKNVKIADRLFRSLIGSNPAKIELDDCVLTEGQPSLLATSLKTNNKLRTLALPQTKLSSEESIALLESLKGMQVKELRLEGFGLDNRVLNALAALLRENEHIQKLSFSPAVREDDADWTANFAGALESNKTIKEIQIVEPREGAGGKEGRVCLLKADIEFFLEALEANTSVTKWDMGSSPWRATHLLFDAGTWTGRWGKASAKWDALFERNRQIALDCDKE